MSGAFVHIQRYGQTDTFAADMDMKKGRPGERDWHGDCLEAAARQAVEGRSSGGRMIDSECADCTIRNKAGHGLAGLSQSVSRRRESRELPPLKPAASELCTQQYRRCQPRSILR